MTPAKHKFHGRLNALNGVLFGNSTIENPELGLIATINGQVCVYDNVGGTIGWYPIAKAMDTKTYRHTQVVPSTEWTVTHNLGTKEFFAVVTDEESNSIVSYAGLEYDPVNPLNKFKVFFAEPISGNMFIVVAESFSTPELNTSKITLGDLVISTGGISWQGNYINMSTFVAVDESISALTNALATVNSSVNAVTGNLSAEVQRAQAAEAQLAASIQSVQTNMQKYAVYDLTFSDAGNVASGQVIFDMVAVRPFSIPANLGGSVAVADVAPAAATTFNVTVNGVIKFAIAFAGGATTATFPANPALNVAAGDRVRVVASRADASIKNMAVTIPTTLL